MPEFTSGDDVQAFLERVDAWLNEPVTAFLVGGTALTIRELGGRTEDIDMAFCLPEHFDLVHDTLIRHGFTTIDELTTDVEAPGRTVLLQHETEGFRVDLFDRQVVGKVTITMEMEGRATEFRTGDNMTAYVLSSEDLFLLKAVSGGDLDAGRPGDLNDLVRLAQTAGFDFEAVLAEIENQRPFNTGAHEAQLIRDGAHPLLAIDISLIQLTGLPGDFTNEISTLATECQAEKRVLDLVESGVEHINDVINRTIQELNHLEEDDQEVVRDAIDRLVEKNILRRVEYDRRHQLDSNIIE